MPAWEAKLRAAQAGGQLRHRDVVVGRLWNERRPPRLAQCTRPRRVAARPSRRTTSVSATSTRSPAGRSTPARLARPFWTRADREEWAAEAAAAWNDAVLRPPTGCLQALRVNRLLPERSRPFRSTSTTRFLSAFAHPSARGYEAIYGRNSPERMGSFDHYASELALLYVITIAAAELDIFARMARRPPRLHLSGCRRRRGGDRGIRASRRPTSGFLGGAPTMFDRIDTVHTPAGRTKPKWGRPRTDPATIGAAHVRYYADPLDRLVKLHSSYQEIATGLAYRSPFERSDARLR